jgi:hypothetical protein
MRHSKQKRPRFSFSSPITESMPPNWHRRLHRRPPFFNRHQCTWPSLKIAFDPPTQLELAQLQEYRESCLETIVF